MLYSITEFNSADTDVVYRIDRWVLITSNDWVELLHVMMVTFITDKGHSLGDVNQWVSRHNRRLLTPGCEPVPVG